MLLARTRASSWPVSRRPRPQRSGWPLALIRGRGSQLVVSPAEPCGRPRGRLVAVGAGRGRLPAIRRSSLALLAVAPFRVSVSDRRTEAYLLVAALRRPRSGRARPRLARTARRRGKPLAAAAGRSRWLRSSPSRARRCSGHAICARAAIELLVLSASRSSGLVVVVAARRWRKWHPRARDDARRACRASSPPIALFQRVTHRHSACGATSSVRTRTRRTSASPRSSTTRASTAVTS